VGVVLSPLIQQPVDPWRDAGAVDSFEAGKTVPVTLQYASPVSWSGNTDQTIAWLKCDEKAKFTAFAVYCTHLGCPVHWLQIPQLFLCPCHGSIFNGDGTVAGGPAPRPMFTYETRIRAGRVQIKVGNLPVDKPWGGVEIGS
jgi:menaquinol-cytochrome c reductase iron-sulfur subunit